MIDRTIDRRMRSLSGGFEAGGVLPFAKRRITGPLIFSDRAGPVDFAPGVPREPDVRPHLHISLPGVTCRWSGALLTKVVSDQVYQGKLRSAPSCNKHALSEIRGGISKTAGIQFVPVGHTNNKQSSREEASVIASLVDDLLNAKFGLTQPRALSLEDVLIVAPYNAQVNLLRQTLPEGARAGSVDLFQGQEAPVVIVSMCASNAEEIPRGLVFLFSQNRLNVAISRAQALALVVANPALANMSVKRLDQMKLVNFFCRLSE